MRFIGDVVLTTPVLRAVRKRYPNAYLAYLGEREAVSLLEHNPYLDEILTFDFSRPTILEQPRVIASLRKRSFDVFIDLFCNPRTAIIARLSGARMRIGKDVPGRGALYTHRIGDDGVRRNAIAFHYRYVEPIDVAPDGWKTEIFLTEDERREARTYLKWQDVDPDRPIIALHPGATWPAKVWMPERFADLADLLQAKMRAQVLLLQGPRDAERAQEVSRRSAAQLLALPPMNLRQVAGILSCCTACVTNDNGVMHIAAAVGTRTIGLFGPGEEDVWFPYNGPFDERHLGHAALRKDVPCHPCHLNVCNRTGDGYMECMKLLTVREVLEEVERGANGR